MSPIAVPSAMTRFFICSEESILSRRARSMFNILPRKGSIAWMRLSLPIFAVPPAESPSTIKSSASSALLVCQSASLPGNVIPSSAPLRRMESFAALAALRAFMARVVWVFFEECCERFGENGLRCSARFHGAEFALGLTLELHLTHFYGDDRRQAFKHVLAGKGVVLLAAVLVDVVECARKRRFESRHVHATFGVVDVVGEGRKAARNIVDVLHDYLHLHTVLFFFYVENILVDGF